MPSFMDRAKVAWDILRDNKGPKLNDNQIITSVMSPSNTTRVVYDNTKTVLAPIVNRISIDASSIPIRHVIIDEVGQFQGIKKSELNDRLSIMANVDQTGVNFIQDAVVTMLHTGTCAIVPVHTSGNPNLGSYDPLSMRVGEIIEWKNYAVTVSIYNELTGQRVEKILPKSFVAIPYNPMYQVMNAPNSTLQRLISKLALLDTADNNLYSQQLDIVLQLPYTLKTERRQNEAERRLKALEDQLYDRKYGVAYIDASERVTQLNRPVTNSLMENVKTLLETLHSQLGLSPTIFAGTATPEEQVLYNNRTVLPVVKAITDAMVGAFFSRTAISQGNYIMAIPNLFKMAPLDVFADAADKLTRNEIMTSNEVRGVVGLPPSKEKGADELRNKNLNAPEPDKEEKAPPEEESVEEEPEKDNKE